MRFKNRMMLTIGCVSLLLLSIPAFSLPSPQANAQKQLVVQKKNIVQSAKPHSTKGRANIRAARAARENRAARIVSMPISETPKRPIFGWPALVSEARKYMGTNPTARSRLWCATFMNLVLAKVGYAGTNSNVAKSFAHYGYRISEPQIGAIAVLTRGTSGGHVGVVSGIDTSGNPIIISGNHGRRVGEAIYPRSRVIAYVMPSDRGTVGIQLAARSQPSQQSQPNQPSQQNQPNRSTPERRLESPIAELLAAIEAEQKRSERSKQPVAQARPAEQRRLVQQVLPKPAEPHLTVRQLPEQPRPIQRAGTLPLSPALAKLLGLKDRAQAAPPSRMAPPQHERQIQHNRLGAVARSDTGLAGALSFR